MCRELVDAVNKGFEIYIIELQPVHDTNSHNTIEL